MSNRWRWTLVVWVGLAVALIGYVGGALGLPIGSHAVFTHHIAWLFGAVCGGWALHPRDGS